MKILITGTAGFIGYHTVLKLADRCERIIGIDSINDYYDVNLKYGRLADTGIDKDSIMYNVPVVSNKFKNYSFIKLNIEDRDNLKNLFEKEKFTHICHLAAQAGVRYSLENPYAYIDSNIIGFMNILELCRHNTIQHLVYASSSSVYGLNEKIPFSTNDNVDHPVSLYAATKKSNELMAHVYSHLYNIPVTGLRFFTVYGPWGRPDMAYFSFTKTITERRTINIFNNGDMIRDFTYIDDIVEGIAHIIEMIPKGNANWSGNNPDPSSSKAPYKIYNIGNNNPVKILDFVKIIENELGMESNKIFLPMQAGDVYATYADIDDIVKDTGFRPSTTIENGMKKFIAWYKRYYTS